MASFRRALPSFARCERPRLSVFRFWRDHPGRFAQGPEDRLEDLVLLVAVVVDLADHRADQRQVFLQQLLVAPRVLGQVGAEVGRDGRVGRLGLDGLDTEIVTDDRGDQAVLGLEMAEQGDLVDAGLAGDRAGGRAGDAVAGKDPRGAIQQFLAGGGGGCGRRGRFHASNYLHTIGGRQADFAPPGGAPGGTGRKAPPGAGFAQNLSGGKFTPPQHAA